MAEILPEPVTAGMPYIGRVPEESRIPGKPEPGDYTARAGRPGWIPPEILCDWDTDPYAYQTEEELMPAGGPHGRLLSYIVGITDGFLRKENLMLLPDVFMLYRDSRGVKQRIGPDLLLMPFRFPAPSSYDLDTEPLPEIVTEITSPKSRPDDMGGKISFYTGLGIPAYLVIDLFTSRKKLRKKIGLHLWRNTGGRVLEIQPDAGGWLPLPEMKLKTKAQGRNLIFADIVTGEVLLTSEEEAELRKQETARAEAAEEMADQARKDAMREAAANLLKAGTDVKIIAGATGLTEEEITALKSRF